MLPSQSTTRPAPNLQLSMGSNGPIIMLNGKQITTSGYAPHLYELSTVAPTYTPLSVDAVSHIDPNSCALGVRYPNGITANFVYTLSGTDLTIKTTASTGATPLQYPVSFRPLGFQFGQIPTGTLAHWSPNELDYYDYSKFEPSQFSPYGCPMASDGTFAVVGYMPSEIAQQSLVSAEGQSTDTTLPATCNIACHTTRMLPANSSVTITTVFRITTDFTPAGLYSGYKALLPKSQVVRLNQPGIQFDGFDESLANTANPRGYDCPPNDPMYRRWDLAAGVERWYDAIIGPIPSTLCPTVLAWAPGGYIAGQAHYPVDAETGPLQIKNTLQPLINRLKARGCRVGILVRIGDVPLAGGQYRRADPTNPADVQAMLTRVDLLFNQFGFNAIYADSVGYDFASIEMLRLLRAHIGPRAPIYVEHPTVKSLLYGDAYCEWDGAQLANIPPDWLAVMQYLMPDAVWMCVDKSGPANSEVVTGAALQAMGYTPLVQDYLVGSMMTGVKVVATTD